MKAADKHFVTTLDEKALDKIPFWQWPALLAFDTPAVTVLWLALFARVLYVPLESPHYLITAGCVWLFLALSRTVRTAWEAPQNLRDPRVRFFRAERWPLLTICPFVLISVAIMAVTRLRWIEQAGLFLLGSLGLLYLVFAFFFPGPTQKILSREIVAPLLCGALIAHFTLANGIFPPSLVASLLVLTTMVFVLCFWTSSLLEWRDRLKSTEPFSPKLFERKFSAVWVCAFFSFLAIALAALPLNAPFTPILIGVGAAAANLALLAAFGECVPGITARCLSRLLLLTPAVPLLRFAAGW